MAKIIVTGATGNLGGGIINHLLEKGVAASDITALVRKEDQGAGYNKVKDLGVNIRVGSYDDPASLANAFDGMDKLMFVSSPDYDNTLRIKQHANVVYAARNAKVSQIVYTSFAYAQEMNAGGLEFVHQATENMIKTTNITYTFLRNGFYFENILGSTLDIALKTGEYITASGTEKFNFVYRDDLALAGAVVLTEDGHDNVSYDLVNSKGITFDEFVEVLSSVYGKEIKHVNLEPDKAIAKYVELGEVPAIASFNVFGVFLPIGLGQFSKTSDVLEKLIGRKCTSVKEVVEKLK